MSENAKAVTININPELHNTMRALSKRHRRHVGALYEEALEQYIDHINNYQGVNQNNKQHGKEKVK